MARIISGELLGDLTKWNDERGFGFITPDGGGTTVFLHISAFRGGGTRPQVGDRLLYAAKDVGEGRLEARWAQRADDPSSPLIPQEKVPWGTHYTLSVGVLAAFGALLVTTASVGRLPFWVLGLYGVTSVATIIVYWIDKRAAERRRWRIPEGTLWLLGLIGGWPGAAVAQIALRHKYAKVSFQLVFWLTVIINVGLFLLLLHPFWEYNALSSTTL